MADYYLIYQHVMYNIVHYCTFWMILTCLITAGISWRLFTILSAQSLGEDDAGLAWWVTAVWGSAALVFFLVGLLLN
ncbi:MAG: hypothetical protein H6Q73_2649 [Firmicutes bacterium]|nr:hypothetical protein [Bacillota bacterium]